MNALITGMHGTIAPVLTEILRRQGHLVTSWDRSKVPVDNEAMVADYISRLRPDWFFHLANGNPSWAGSAARTCRDLGIGFLYTSTASVFSIRQRGPFTPLDIPEPEDDYGRYKLACEQLVRAENLNAIVVRLGWQIGSAPGGNQMVEYFEQQQLNHGRIEASEQWIPACSFLTDTAQSLIRLMNAAKSGLYHLDANPGLNMYEIADGLRRIGKRAWDIVPVSTPDQNNRLIGGHVEIRSIVEELGGERQQ